MHWGDGPRTSWWTLRINQACSSKLEVSSSERTSCPSITCRRGTCNQSEAGEWKALLGACPSSIKHAIRSHFTLQHLPTVPERYTYSSLSKMFKERNYQQEKQILWRGISLWAVSISVEMLTMGVASGLNVVGLRDLGGTPLCKNPRAGRFCHLSACLYDWAER